MNEPRFDPNRPYGTIHPPLASGAMIEQDGHHFTGSMHYIAPTNPDGAARAAGASAPASPSAEPSSQQDTSTTASDDIDLQAWAMRVTNYPFFSVKAAVKERYPGIDAQSTRTIMDGLISVGVVTREQAKR